MTHPPLTAGELKEMLAEAGASTIKAVETEIRRAGLITEPTPAVPPPMSPDDEEMVLAALLEGRCHEVLDLDPAVFCSGFRRWLFGRLQQDPELPAARLAEEEPGYAPNVEDLARRAYRHEGAIMDAARHIVELHRARRLGEKLKALTNEMWLGQKTPDQVIGWMRSINKPTGEER